MTFNTNIFLLSCEKLNVILIICTNNNFFLTKIRSNHHNFQYFGQALSTITNSTVEAWTQKLSLILNFDITDCCMHVIFRNQKRTLMMSILSIGAGAVIFIGLFIFSTYFCLRPTKFIELINCLCKCRVPKNTASRTPSRNSRSESGPQSRNRTPLTSRPASRAPSQGRSMVGSILLRQY